VPIIGLTANSDVDSREVGIAMGMCQILTKPVNGFDLKNAIETAIVANCKVSPSSSVTVDLKSDSVR